MRVPITDSNFQRLLNMLPPLDLTYGPWVAGGAPRKVFQQKNWSIGDIDVFFASPEQQIAWTCAFEKKITENDLPTVDSSDNVFDEQSMLSAYDVAKSKPKSYCYKKLVTDNADTWCLCENGIELNIQLIKARYAKTIKQLWDDFDFTVCQVACDQQTIAVSDLAARDLLKNKLEVVDPANSKCLPMRIIKYHSHGFDVSNDLLLWAATQIVENNIVWDTY